MEWKVGDIFKNLITPKIYKILYIDDTHAVVESLGGAYKGLWRLNLLSDPTKFERCDPDEIKVGDKLMSICNKNVYEVLYVGKKDAMVMQMGQDLEFFISLIKLQDQSSFIRILK